MAKKIAGFFFCIKRWSWVRKVHIVHQVLPTAMPGRAGLKAITTLSHIPNEKSTHCCHSCHILGVNFTKCESLIKSKARTQRQRNDNMFKPYYETHQLSIYWGLRFNRKLGQSAAPMRSVVNPSLWEKLKVIGSLFRTILNITALSSRHLWEHCVQHVLQLEEQTGFVLVGNVVIKITMSQQCFWKALEKSNWHTFTKNSIENGNPTKQDVGKSFIFCKADAMHENKLFLKCTIWTLGCVLNLYFYFVSSYFARYKYLYILIWEHNTAFQKWIWSFIWYSLSSSRLESKRTCIWCF